jgi:hypothetical protein
MFTNNADMSTLCNAKLRGASSHPRTVFAYMLFLKPLLFEGLDVKLTIHPRLGICEALPLNDMVLETGNLLSFVTQVLVRM